MILWHLCYGKCPQKDCISTEIFWSFCSQWRPYAWVFDTDPCMTGLHVPSTLKFMVPSTDGSDCWSAFLTRLWASYDHSWNFFFSTKYIHSVFLSLVIVCCGTRGLKSIPLQILVGSKWDFNSCLAKKLPEISNARLVKDYPKITSFHIPDRPGVYLTIIHRSGGKYLHYSPTLR